MALPFARLKQLMVHTMQWEYERNREGYKRQAFLAWHNSNTLAGMFGGSKEMPTFSEFLDSVGLGDGVEETTQAETAQEAVGMLADAFGIEMSEEDIQQFLKQE